MNHPSPPAAAPEAVHEAVDAAVMAAWTFFVRGEQQGLEWEDIAGCQSPADFRAKLASQPDELVHTCRALLDYNVGLGDDERAACARLLAIVDALALRPVPREPRIAALPTTLVHPEDPAPVNPPADDPAPPSLADEPAARTDQPLSALRWLSLAALALAAGLALGRWSAAEPQDRPATRVSATPSASIRPDPSASSASPFPATIAGNPAARSPTPTPAPTPSATRPAPSPSPSSAAAPKAVPTGASAPRPIQSPSPRPVQTASPRPAQPVDRPSPTPVAIPSPAVTPPAPAAVGGPPPG